MNKAIECFEKLLEKKKWKERNYQRESIEKIINYFDRGMKLVMYSAPTGAGKSIVNASVAEGYKSSYYVTGNLALQDQLLRDFDFIADIRGRNNYKCRQIAANCDEGICQYKRKFRCTAPCEYLSAKELAIESKICMTNIFYFILEGGRDFDRRELLIVDEGHNLPEQLVDFSRATISKRNTNENVAKHALSISETHDSKSFTEALLEVVNEEIESYDGLNQLDTKQMKEYKNLKSLCYRLMNCLDAGGIVIEKHKQEGYEWIVVQPLMARGVAEKLIFNRADKVLISSATINPFMIADELNVRNVLGLGKTAYFTVPSLFPVERRPIFLMPVCNFKYSNQTLDNEMKIVDAVASVIKSHQGERGVVFCQSYRYSEMVKAAIIEYPELDRRLIFHTEKNRKEVLRSWLRGAGKLGDDTVLVGIKMEEGLDLKYDTARFSICFKAPFTDGSSDARIRKRLELKHWNWYYNLAMQTLLQAYGRIVRAEDDHGSMYVLDEAACMLFKRKGVPKWIQDAIVEVR